MDHLTSVLNCFSGRWEDEGRALMPSAGWLVTLHRDKLHTWVSEEEKADLLSSGDNQDTWWSLIILSGTYIQTWGIWLQLCIGDFPLNFYKFNDSPESLIVLKLCPLRYCRTSFGAVIFHIQIKKKKQNKNMTIHEFCSTWNLEMEIHLKHLMEIWERWYIMQFLYEFFMWLIIEYLRWLSLNVSKMTFFQRVERVVKWFTVMG